MLRPGLSLCACPLLAIAAMAQQATPDPAAVMDNVERQMAPMARAWLNSADPRVRAWGAYMVLRDRRTEAIPDLLAILAGFPVVEEPAMQADVDERDAMLAVLDALIEFGAEVPAGDAQRIYPEFPVQSLILLSRAPNDAQAGTSPALLDIFKCERRRPAAWLAAGNVLLQRRAEGFAAAVVEGMTVHALVTVTQPGAGGFGSGSASCCGGGLPTKSKAGWPPVGVYGFAGCGERVQPGSTVLAPGTDPAYYHRHVDAGYQTASECGCNLDRDLASQHYLTALLFASEDRPPVRAHVAHTIVWQGVQAYRSELEGFVGEQQGIFAELARRLGDGGQLSAEDVKTLRPALQIQIWDQRPGQQPALPAITTAADNVTIESH
jgi:hypothetical protein